MKKTGLFIVCVLLSAFVAGQNSGHPRFGIPYRLHPGTMNQTEVFIVKSPLDEDILFASCNTLNFIPFFISEGIYSTHDGGATWQGNDTCTGTPIAYHGADPGIVIDRNGTFILTRLGRSPFTGLYSHYSTDEGQTWSAQKAISTDDLERATLASDANPASAHYGRTYAAWVKFAPPYPLVVAHSDNGAQSWSTPVAINNPPNRSAGGDMSIGPGGVVYVCWAGVTDVSPFREIYTGFASTENGGQSWFVNENAFSMNGITGILSEKDNIRVNGLPGIAVDTTQGLFRGRIYIVTGQKDLMPAGNDPDIILNRSSDGGKTWSAGIRVNQDVLNNGKIQYFPSVEVDHTGGVNVIYYDDRFTTSDSTGVMLARSTDGGDTWKEYLISRWNFKPTPIGGLGQGYQGDNIDLVSTNEKLWPVWMDNSTGVYQIWTVPIDYSEINSINEADNLQVRVFPAIPNPFSHSTQIYFSTKQKGRVSIELFDLTGRHLILLNDEVMEAGDHQCTIHPSSFSGLVSLQAGVLFYTIRLNQFSATGKLIYTGQ
jgi:hypothetical protein